MLSMASTGFDSVALLGLMSSIPFGGKLMAAGQSLKSGSLIDRIPHFSPQSQKYYFPLHGTVGYHKLMLLIQNPD